MPRPVAPGSQPSTLPFLSVRTRAQGCVHTTVLHGQNTRQRQVPLGPFATTTPLHAVGASVGSTETFDEEHKANDECHDRQDREGEHDEEGGRRRSVIVTGVTERATWVGREDGREK